MSNIFLVADIGGTNARFALLEPATGDAFASHIYQVAEHGQLRDALGLFLNSYLGAHTITAAALAIAGPVLSETVKLTNCPWVCDKREIAGLLRTNNVYLFNDFEAVALAIPSLRPHDLETLQAGGDYPHQPMVIMGPGTGLGVAGFVMDEAPRAFATESGHIRYAPADAKEEALLATLKEEIGFISAECLLSGPGLINIYKACCRVQQKEILFDHPARLVEAAQKGDALACEVTDLFSAILGRHAATMALTWKAVGGLYLCGGVLGKLGGLFNRSLFLSAFNENPAMKQLLALVPVHRVLVDIPAFRGLYTYLSHCQK